VASLYERLKREEAAVSATLAALHEELGTIHQRMAAAEERLRVLALTRETLDSLPPDAEEPGGPDAPADEAGAQGGEPAAAPGSAQGSGPAFGPVGPTSWEEGRRRMLSVLATAGKAMRARHIAAAIGEDVSTPARVETARGRLKKLVDEGHVVEGPTGWFAIASAHAARAAGEGAAGEG